MLVVLYLFCNPSATLPTIGIMKAIARYGTRLTLAAPVRFNLRTDSK